jgi:hypothetical protein
MSEFKKTLLRRVHKKSRALILGYTRHGHPVHRPRRDAPDADSYDCTGDWAREDHKDAAGILAEHGEREQDPLIASWCARWARLHRDVSRRPIPRAVTN